jgi:hypothetical protein
MSNGDKFEFELTKDDERKLESDIVAKYRLTLLSGTGMEVLMDILVNFCHFGCYLENEKDVAQYNIGVSILSRCGIISKGNEAEVVKALCSVSPKRE